MKKISKIMAMMLALFMVLSLAAPAKAANLEPDYEPYKGTDADVATFDKFLVIDENASIPDITFKYTIVPNATTISPAADEQIVQAGPATPTITSEDGDASEVVFAPTDPSYTTPQTGDEKFTLDGGMRYAKKTLTVSFAGLEFPEPGVYRYKITEQEITDRDDVDYDTQASTPGSKIRFLDVYVVDNNGTLEIAGYVMHEDETHLTITEGVVSDPNATWVYDGTTRATLDAAKAAADLDVTENTGTGKWEFGGNEYDSEEEAKAAAYETITAVLSDKNDFFVNEIETHDLHFGKEVKGNQGSKDKYFKFTLNLSEIPEGTTILFDLKDAQTDPSKNTATQYDPMKNTEGLTQVDGTVYSYTFSAGETNKDFVFYLKHNEYVHVLGLPKTTAYNLSEEAEDYKSTAGTTKVAGYAYNGTVYETEALAKTAADADITGPDTNDEYTWNGTKYASLDAAKDAAYATIAQKLYNDGITGDLSADVYTGFTNTRGGVIPTGVFLAAVPGTILAGGALLYLFGKKRHEEEE